MVIDTSFGIRGGGGHMATARIAGWKLATVACWDAEDNVGQTQLYAACNPTPGLSFVVPYDKKIQ